MKSNNSEEFTITQNMFMLKWYKSYNNGKSYNKWKSKDINQLIRKNTVYLLQIYAEKSTTKY